MISAESMDMRVSPYPHLVRGAAFSVPCINALQTWAGQHHDWIRQLGYNYRFWSLSDVSSLHLAIGDYYGELENWRKSSEKFFNIKKLGKLSLDVFRFTNGDGIGIHDDSALDVVRLAVIISETLSWNHGGALVLFGSRADETIVYQAETNGGLCFETKAIHRHAVTTINHSVLLILMAQFQKLEL